MESKPRRRLKGERFDPRIHEHTWSDLYPTRKGRMTMVFITDGMQKLLVEEEHQDHRAWEIAHAGRDAYRDADEGRSLCIVCDAPLVSGKNCMPVCAWSVEVQPMRGIVCLQCRLNRRDQLHELVSDVFMRRFAEIIATRRRSGAVHPEEGHA